MLSAYGFKRDPDEILWSVLTYELGHRYPEISQLLETIGHIREFWVALSPETKARMLKEINDYIAYRREEIRAWQDFIINLEKDKHETV